MLLTMSTKELTKLELIQHVCDKRIRQIDAAQALNLSRRQIQRLVNLFRELGPQGLVSKKRTQPGNHQYCSILKSQVLELIHTHYRDFGPTLISEKLSEIHNIKLSNETIRQWMIASNLWTPKQKKRRKVYQPRARRDCLGELIQLDGSPHDWFEGRSDECTLLVFIDDATSAIMHMYCESESTLSYMTATRQYIDKHGKPVAFYTDKHGVFRVNHASNEDKNKLTQYGRALKELNIELICANTPQAKGRVERANKTLQDRLPKEMRLAGVSGIEEANQWLGGFIEDYNRRFAKPAKRQQNVHRPIYETQSELYDIFSWQLTRQVSNALTLQYDRVRYLLDNTPENESLCGKNVMIYDYPDGSINIKYLGRSLSFKAFDHLEVIRQGEIVENKRLGEVLKLAKSEQERMENEGQRERRADSPRRQEQHRQVRLNLAVSNSMKKEMVT
ncbi:ISNCY family transposase [Vibrio parahaemolyticus]|uniref:ISNCY family transposase n=1 Tax=Vibrio parahaemolyticus TaxID=670 RepID=UPI00111D238E|nr:ISNCY family transposase [Vibrio parahaemolyticus]TOG88383.1 ISNCY family transposase [Vibrio parahaemolyticus]